MRLSFVVPLLIAVGIAAFAQDAMPRMSTADPSSGKKGDVIVVAGENLDKANVIKVYLTNGKDDLECSITGQTATEIKFKIPDKANGRMALMILTGGKEPRLIEQPVKVTIE
jgi:hypothetical protein